jgi:hypothetical protein
MLDKSVNISDLITRLEGGDGQVAAPGGVKKNVNPAPEQLRGTGEAPSGGPRMTAQPPLPPPPPEKPEEKPKIDGPVGPDEIRKHWNTVVAAIRHDKPALAPLIGAAEPVSFRNDILKLQIPAEGYSISRLNDSRTRGAIAAVVSSVFGLGPVDIEIEPVPPGPGHGAGNDNQPREENPSGGSFEQLCKTDPLMGKIKELFDPELLG